MDQDDFEPNFFPEENFDEADDLNTDWSRVREKIKPKRTERAVNDFAEAINLKWRKMGDGALEAATLCFRASVELFGPAADALKAKLNMTASTFSKLAKIGSCRHFEDPTLRDKLPLCWTKLYSLADVDVEVLRKAVEDKRITPQSTRAEIDAWKQEIMPGRIRKKEASETAKRPAQVASDPQEFREVLAETDQAAITSPLSQAEEGDACDDDDPRIQPPRYTELHATVYKYTEAEVEERLKRAFGDLVSYKIVRRGVDDY